MICLPAFAKSFSVIGLRIGNHLFFKHSQKLLLQTLMTRWIFGGSFGFWTESMDIQEYNLFRLIKKFFDIPNVWIEEIDYKIYKKHYNLFGGIVLLSFVLDVYWLTQERFVTFENFLVRGQCWPLDHHTGELGCPKIVFPSPVGSRSSLLGWWNTYSQCCEQSILWIVWSRRSRECPGSLPNDKLCLINTT